MLARPVREGGSRRETFASEPTMNMIKTLSLAACVLAPLASVPSAHAEDVKPAASDASKAKPTKAQIEAMLTKCSDEADAKGLFVKSGKGAARKAFRRECMAKLGVEPK